MDLDELRKRAARAARLAYLGMGPVGPDKGLCTTEALGVVLELQGALKGMARRLTPGAMHARTPLERLRLARVLLLIEQVAQAEPELPLLGGEGGFEGQHELAEIRATGWFTCRRCGQTTLDPEDPSPCPGDRGVAL